MNGLFDFDFDFQDVSREDLLTEAERTMEALGNELGPDTQTQESAKNAFDQLVEELKGSVAQFGESPEVLELEERHFTDHGLLVPVRFKDLAVNHRFYWIRLPFTFWTQDNLPFVKLECGLEFNPQTPVVGGRPLAQMILPDKKFAQQLEVTGSLNLQIGQNFEFEATSGKIEGSLGSGKASLQAGVEAKEAGKLGIMAGPFMYKMKKALIDHSPPGTEKVFWRLSGAQFFQEDVPTLIVVAKVPRDLPEVQMVAVLQAYHRPNLLAQFFAFFSKRLASFFEKGAPLLHEKEWFIPPRK